MTIESLISSVDELYPNALTKPEKAKIAYELSCQIRSEVKRLYAEHVFECESDMTYLLPEHIGFEDIVSVYEGGAAVDKIDARINRAGGICEYRAVGSTGVRIVYLTRPEPYVDYELSDYSITGRVITSPGFSFRPGDTLVFTEGENEGKSSFVLAKLEDGYLISDTLAAGNFSGGCQVHRMYTTEVAPPHDSMYVDFLLGKIMFYQQDFETAAQYLLQFNAKWDAFVGAYKRTEPQVKTTHLRNLW